MAYQINYNRFLYELPKAIDRTYDSLQAMQEAIASHFKQFPYIHLMKSEIRQNRLFIQAVWHGYRNPPNKRDVKTNTVMFFVTGQEHP